MLILFFASFTHSVAGFGFAMVSMPPLVGLVGVRVATPMTALLSILIQVPILLRYRKSFRWPNIVQLAITVTLGVPIGVLALKRVNPDIITTLLGVIVAGYALYSFFAPRLPELKSPLWAYPFGLLSGILSGAYSTGGPPLIIYADFKQWEPAEFKVNLQGIFMFTSAAQMISHLAAHNLTVTVWKDVLFALPGVIVGAVIGLSLDKVINLVLFRKIVLFLLVLLGLRLIF